MIFYFALSVGKLILLQLFQVDNGDKLSLALKEKLQLFARIFAKFRNSLVGYSAGLGGN